MKYSQTVAKRYRVDTDNLFDAICGDQEVQKKFQDTVAEAISGLLGTPVKPYNETTWDGGHPAVQIMGDEAIIHCARVGDKYVTLPLKLQHNFTDYAQEYAETGVFMQPEDMLR